MRRRDVLALGLVSLPAALRPRSASAQAKDRAKYPEHPIRLVVPRTAGGVVDVVARLWAERVKSQLGAIVIENQGGGGGTIAATAVARAAGDGYTLLAGTTSELVINPVIMSQPSYDPVKDFVPIAITAVSVSSLMVHESVPVRTLPELIAYAKANPGKLRYGSAGTGTPSHLCGELFKLIAGLPDIVHVPYKSAAPGLADFFSGHIPMMVASISPAALEMHRSGKIRDSGRRHRSAPARRARRPDQHRSRLSRTDHAAIHGTLCAGGYAVADHRADRRIDAADHGRPGVPAEAGPRRLRAGHRLRTAGGRAVCA